MLRSFELFCLICTVTSFVLRDPNEQEHRYHPRRKYASSFDERPKSPWTGTDWNKHGKDSIDYANTKMSQINKGKAKNVIMFLGDGLGLATVAAARLYQKETRGLSGNDTYLTWEKFPFAGLSRTYNVDRSTPDGAGTATAYLCGVKANMGTIGVNENVLYGNCTATKGNEVKSITKHSIAADKWTGIVTTASVTDASPAGCYANVADRDWEAFVFDDVPNRDSCHDIAYQLIHNEDNKDIRVILGGGVSSFIPVNETDDEYKKGGQRKDGKNLINDWKAIHVLNNTAYVKNRHELLGVNLNETDYLMGLFQTSHMSYEADRNQTREPSLSEMTETAINLLSRSPKGYFLFVEGGRIDHSHHDSSAFKALNDTIAMADAVQKAVNMTNETDTLIVVTADHSHVFTLGGYGSFEESVFGFGDPEVKPAKDDKPYLQLNYGNGPSFEFHRMVNGTETPRMNITDKSITAEKTFVQDTGIWLPSETHGGEDVAIYASGPMAHLFHATHEQSYIAHVMMYASCVGDYQNQEHCKTQDTSHSISLHDLKTRLVLMSAWLIVLATKSA